MRFLEPKNYTRTDILNQCTVPSKKIKLTTSQSLSRIPKNTPPSSAIYPKSLPVADFLFAGRIVRPNEEIEALLVLEFFDIYKGQWFKLDPRRLHIVIEKFAIGGFRNVFKAGTTNVRECWVIKRFEMKEWEMLEPIYNMDLQTHTRKQVQMHITVKIIAEKLVTKAKNSKVFTRHFSYSTSYFATLDNEPITVERFADGEFTTYVNNDGNPCLKMLVKSSLFEQAETFVHFSYESSSEKLLLVDLQGEDYNSYNPDIATTETLIEAPSAEEFFCTGNLRETAINDFYTARKCNVICLELKKADMELGESEKDEENNNITFTAFTSKYNNRLLHLVLLKEHINVLF